MSESTPEGGKAGASGDESYEVNNNNASKSEKSKENSPEHAGVVRGLARSAAHRGASHIAVGRLPLGSHAHGIHHSISSAKIARIKNLAKVSERANIGYEVVEAHHHASSAEAKKKKTSNNTNGTTLTTKKGPSWTSQVSTFAGSLVKNTVLGMAVFHTYEAAIGRFAVPSEESPHESSDRREAPFDEKQPLPLWKHYAAGFCAGGAHAFLGSLMDGLSASRTTAFSSITATPSMKPLQTMARVFYPNFLQHSASHAFLFGSYMTVKRTATVAMANATTELGNETNISEMKHQNDQDDFFDEDLIPVVFAGGIAGITQQFASDITKQFTKAVSHNASTPSESFLSAMKLPKYTPRSLLLVSIPTAIGMVAFEYGRQEEELEE